jgi:hypothetical protein
VSLVIRTRGECITPKLSRTTSKEHRIVDCWRNIGYLFTIGGAFSVALSLINTVVPISWHVSYYICRVLDHGFFLAAGVVMVRTYSGNQGGRIPGCAIILYGGIGVALYVYGAFDNALHFSVDAPRATLVYLVYGMLCVAGGSLAAKRSVHPTKLPGTMLMTYAIYTLAVELCRDLGLTAIINDLGTVDASLPVMIAGAIYFVQIALNGCIVAAGSAFVKHAGHVAEEISAQQQVKQ